MDRLFYVGVSAALFAAFAFSLNFVVPFIIGDYSTFDFALVRHVVSALVGLYILFSQKVQSAIAADCLQAIWLAFVGYVGYFLTVTGAAVFAGPVIAPAFLGLVPIVLMVIGNQREGSLPWRSLMMPLALVLVGLVLVNGTAFTAEGLNSVRSLWVGVPLALAAVGLWVWFALANQAALAARPEVPSRCVVGPDIDRRWRLDAGLLSGRRRDGSVSQLPTLGIRLERRRQFICLGCIFRAAGNGRRRLGLEHCITKPARCLGCAIDRFGNSLRCHRGACRACSLANPDRSRWGGCPDRRRCSVSEDFLRPPICIGKDIACA